MELANQIQVENYSKEWWDDFLTRTDNLAKTSIFKDCIAKEETHLLRTYILQIIQTLAKLRTNRYGYRVYVDGKLLDNTGMTLVYDAPPYDNEELEDWVKRV